MNFPDNSLDLLYAGSSPARNRAGVAGCIRAAVRPDSASGFPLVTKPETRLELGCRGIRLYDIYAVQTRFVLDASHH
jgi:hypothetical protein